MSTESTASLPRGSGEEADVQPPSKKQRTYSGEEPDDGTLDTIVVVAGKEYRECSSRLRDWSEYFDAAFRSGMKQAQTKRFEFPNMRPEKSGSFSRRFSIPL